MVEAVYGLLQRQRMQCLSRPNRPDQIKESRVFQVDLLYPPAKDRPAGTSGAAVAAGAPRSGTASLPGSVPTSPDAQSTASASAAAAAAAAASGGAARPVFAELLQQSLKVQSEMRAWFDEEVRAAVGVGLLRAVAGARTAAQEQGRSRAVGAATPHRKVSWTYSKHAGQVPVRAADPCAKDTGPSAGCQLRTAGEQRGWHGGLAA